MIDMYVEYFKGLDEFNQILGLLDHTIEYDFGFKEGLRGILDVYDIVSVITFPPQGYSEDRWGDNSYTIQTNEGIYYRIDRYEIADLTSIGTKNQLHFTKHRNNGPLDTLESYNTYILNSDKKNNFLSFKKMYYRGYDDITEEFEKIYNRRLIMKEII